MNNCFYMVTISEAKNLRNNIDIEGTIESKGEVRNVRTRAGEMVDVCDAYLQDSTGDKIKLTLWQENISKVNAGDKVKITGAYTNAYKGEVSLSLGRTGKMDVVQ